METILAQFVTWNNVINDYAVNVQNTLAPVLGAMVAEVAISRNVDAVHLDLVTPFNKHRASPQHHLLVEWMKNQELRDADSALAQARLSLMEFLEGQAEAAASAGRPSGTGPGRLSGNNPFVVDVPRLARQDTSGAATLALLTEAPAAGLPSASGSGQDSSGGGGDRSSAGRRAGATAEASTTAASGGVPARASDGGALAGRPGSDGLPSGPGRPPGTAESASTDASDMPEPPQTLNQHLQHFNGCVASLQQHLGPNFGVYFHVTPAACPVRGRCAYVRLMRHKHPTKQAAAVSAGTPGNVDRAQQQQQLQKARTLGRQSQRAGPPGLAAAAAAAALAAASPPPPLPSRTPSRAPSRMGSATSFGRISGAGTLRPAPPADPPPPPGSAAAIFGEDAAPVTLVDIVHSGITDAILRAERSVAVVGNELARLFERYEPPLSLVEEPKHCRKLKTLPVAKEYVEANRKIQQLNAVLFKLAKAVAKTAWIYSTPLSMPDGGLGDVAQMVCEALRRVADTAWVMCKRHLDSVHLVTLLTHHEPFTITPRFTNDDAIFRFELEVVVDQSLLMSKTFPDFLPPQIRAVWDSLLALAAVVQESRVSLAPLRGQYKKLHEEVREFYTLAPEAAKARRLSIVEATNVARVVNGNLAAIYEAEQVFDAYGRNVQRLVDAYGRAQREIKADLQLKLAELTTKLPRSIVKPSFSADMLALMRSSVNPTELAATMTLALTAGNLDPAALAVMQQSLAAGAMGGAGGAAAGVAATPPQQQQQQGQVAQARVSNAASVAAAAAAAATGVPSVNPAAAGGGAVAALGGIGILQQQQQQQLAAAQMQLQQQQVAAGTAYINYGMNGTTPPTAAAPPLAGAASRRGSTALGAGAGATGSEAPELAAHGTAADYAAQLAMAQAYGYAYNNPYAGYGMYAPSTLGSITMGSKSSHNLAAGLMAASAGGAAGASLSAGPGAAAGAGPGATGALPSGAGMVGAYQSAGYDANTIAMLAQMGYGGFAVGSSQQQPQQAQQPR